MNELDAAFSVFVDIRDFSTFKINLAILEYSTKMLFHSVLAIFLYIDSCMPELT